MAEMRIPKSEAKKQTEKMKTTTKVKITGTASTPPRVSASMISSQPKTSTPGDKFVDPLYSRNSGNPPIPSMPSVPATMPERTRGAGDANYTKTMKSKKSKQLPKK